MISIFYTRKIAQLYLNLARVDATGVLVDQSGKCVGERPSLNRGSCPCARSERGDCVGIASNGLNSWRVFLGRVPSAPSRPNCDGSETGQPTTAVAYDSRQQPSAADDDPSHGSPSSLRWGGTEGAPRGWRWRNAGDLALAVPWPPPSRTHAQPAAPPRPPSQSWGTAGGMSFVPLLLFLVGLTVLTCSRFRWRCGAFQDVTFLPAKSSSSLRRGLGPRPQNPTNYFILLQMANCAEGQSHSHSHGYQAVSWKLVRGAAVLSHSGHLARRGRRGCGAGPRMTQPRLVLVLPLFFQSGAQTHG